MARSVAIVIEERGVVIGGRVHGLRRSFQCAGKTGIKRRRKKPHEKRDHASALESLFLVAAYSHPKRWDARS
jgi:hypothetical protein